MSTLSQFLARLLLSACCWLPLVGQTYTFQTFSVPFPLVNSTEALGINNRGAIVGRMEFNRRDSHGNIVAATRGFKRFSGGVFEYPIVDPNDADFFTDATGINDSGVIVGRYRDALGNVHAFLLDQGNFTTVDVPGANQTWALGINNRGDYVGSFGIRFGTEHGFVHVGNTITQLDAPGATATVPYGIAEDDSIAGCTVLHNQDFVFIRGPQGRFQTFQIPNAGNQCASGINNTAHLIVGYYIDTAYPFTYHGFTYDYLAGGSGVTDGASVAVSTVDFPGALATEVTGVNANGEIAGYAVLATGHVFGFIGTPAK